MTRTHRLDERTTYNLRCGVRARIKETHKRYERAGTEETRGVLSKRLGALRAMDESITEMMEGKLSSITLTISEEA